ncbi:unnamed protein product, partial [Allacma fusca]
GFQTFSEGFERTE